MNFECKLIWAVFVIGAVIRVMYCYHDYSMYHADEFFQCTEVAHKLYYGYGHVAVEYRQFHAEDNANRHYASSRSHLFPLLFVPVYYLIDLLNLNYYEFGLRSCRILVSIVT